MRILLATLTAGTVSAHYCDSLADLLENPISGVGVRHVFVRGGPRLANQRNIALKYFLETEGGKLLFVDADIKFTTNDLKILLDSDKDIVGARSYGYSEERDETFPNWQPVDESQQKGLIECSHIGMDFTLISRSAIEKLGVRPNEGWPYGYGAVGDLYAATEDILFCHRAREAGLKVFVNADARVYHDKSRLV